MELEPTTSRLLASSRNHETRETDLSLILF